MADRTLTLVRPESRPQPQPAHRAWGPLIGAGLILAFLLASRADLEAARRPPDFSATAESVIQFAAEGKYDDSETQQRLRALQASLAERPLDAKGRSLYAVALLGVSQVRFFDTAAAKFHARLAARTAPVTVSVLSRSSRVLALAGELDEGLALNREMFGFDPDKASELLLRIAPWAASDFLRQVTPETPEAWLAMARALSANDRQDTADDWDRDGLARWPGELSFLRRNLTLASRTDDWATVEQLLEAAGDLPRQPEAALVFTYRGSLRAHQARADEALRDLESGLQLAPRQRSVRILSGDAYARLGEEKLARRHWKWALFDTPQEATAARVRLVARLARSETRDGDVIRAIQHWRTVTELMPEHAEARESLRDLLGPGVQLDATP